jgi:hypothetical protein
METNQDNTVFVWLGANVMDQQKPHPLFFWQLATSPIWSNVFKYLINPAMALISLINRD